MGVAQDDIGNGNGHEILRELAVTQYTVVNEAIIAGSGGRNRRRARMAAGAGLGAAGGSKTGG
ncbi:hypothetical protein MJK72_25815 [Klebsiella pneumoniae]|nr:hypothetical protein MJK72_25815 [Klebsiella pneumoniae]